MHLLPISAHGLAYEILEIPETLGRITRIDDGILQGDEIFFIRGVESPAVAQGGDEAFGTLGSRPFPFDLERGLRLFRVKIIHGSREDFRVTVSNQFGGLLIDGRGAIGNYRRCRPDR